ncbi:hypothetical protein Tco_0407399 [Tanacetum coccineum]
MSQPANDEFSQHLSDDEASNHEDASDTGAAPKQQQYVIPQTTAISNIKLPILKKEENLEKPSELEGLEKGYDRFQQLLSQLEAHGAEVSTEDANHKFLRQMNEIYEKDEKLKRYRRIGMKAVKEKEQLQKTLDSSSKNLWRLINSGMSSNNKLGLGYEIQSNNEVLSYEEEMNFSVFNCLKEDSVEKPLYSRFIKTNNFKGVPHPLSGDYTPTPQEEIDKSLYVYGSIGTSSIHSVESESEISSILPKVYVSSPITTNEKVMVPMPNWVVNHANKFVPRLVQLNAGRPNINSVRPNINTGRTNINSIRPNINTRRTNVNPVRPRVNTGSSNVNIVRSRQLKFCLKTYKLALVLKDHRPFAKTTTQMSHFHAVKGNWGSAVKTSAGYNWRNSKPNSNCDSGPTFIRTVNAKGSSMKNLVEKRLLFDSGCSGHMTGNKDQLEDFSKYSMRELLPLEELGHFNLFSISQICDKQHKVLFTETECLVVSSDFKMPDENQILLNLLILVGFAEMLDFLKGSNLRYALTSNPTIYDFLVKQFWQTATAKTLSDGTLELHATIDTIVYTITEASIRNKL